ncbi:hypothetical protein [Amycolatopsis circi]|uniref:hypothetical protein n=1 Tax=Amycolatopsis circi TaxID=871959 RepID=UPI000E27A53C|nr:hypothetical protein [Amycolatopsis circi]
MVYAPDNHTLRELGRFTWAAMLLEDAVISLCRVIAPGPLISGGLVSQYLAEARDVLKGWPSSADLTEVLTWLHDAETALDEERNQILHATPEALINPDTGEYVRSFGVMPRKGRQGKPDRPYRRRPVEVGHLRDATRRMAMLDARFADIDAAVMLADPNSTMDPAKLRNPFANPSPNPSGNPSDG